jgi:hypothetical protein
VDVTRKQVVAVALCLALSATIAGSATMTYSGFCMSQMRYVPDDEKIHNAAAHIVASLAAAKYSGHRMIVKTDMGYIDYPDSRIIPYDSVE